MKFAFNEDQEALRAAARGFLADHSSPAQVRKVMATEAGYDPDVWRRIGAELGWTAITIPEVYGGLGLTYVELIALLEEMGAALLCAPFFSTICLATNALLLGGTEEQKQAHLPGIAAGETIATLAVTEPKGRWDAAGIDAVAKRAGGGFVLNGVKSFVIDGHTAHLLVVAARSGDGISLFLVPADTGGVGRRLLPTMDQTRKLAEVQLRDVRVPGSALLGNAGEGWPILSKTLDLAAIALAAEQVGGAQRCLDMSVQYAKERVQFGRPIGSFQAIKHKCADMLVKVESARSASYYAGWAASVDDPELPVLASLAKAYCSDAHFSCAAESAQIHGGVGFTWEYDVHLYFKRAKSSEVLLGDPAYHRELVARRIGL
ncbi:MAG: acyl-CoA/acyl-ACP dehydrogenase [Deltaproteobacteria bacterium]|nr:acyl-CoA/acyl-ACP dehydrogenase [Deltaproteobacteria bacterium]